MIQETSAQNTTVFTAASSESQSKQAVLEKSVPEKKVEALAKTALPVAAGETSGCFVFSAKPISDPDSKKKPDDPSEKKRLLKTDDAFLHKKLLKKVEEGASSSSGAKSLDDEKLTLLPGELVKTEAPQPEKAALTEAGSALPFGNKRSLEGATIVQAQKQSKQAEEKPPFSSIAQCKDEFETLAHKIDGKVSPSLSFVMRSCLFFYLKCTFFPALKNAKDYQSLYSLLDEIRNYIKNPSKLSGVDSALREEVMGLLDVFADRILKKSTPH